MRAWRQHFGVGVPLPYSRDVFEESTKRSDSAKDTSSGSQSSKSRTRGRDRRHNRQATSDGSAADVSRWNATGGNQTGQTVFSSVDACGGFSSTTRKLRQSLYRQTSSEPLESTSGNAATSSSRFGEDLQVNLSAYPLRDGLDFSWWELYIRGENPHYPPRQRCCSYLTSAGVNVSRMSIHEIEDFVKWLEMRRVYGNQFPRFPYNSTLEGKVEELKERYPIRAGKGREANN